MSNLPSPSSKLRELLHSRHTETHMVIAESRREMTLRLRYMRRLLINLEEATKQQAKEKRAGLRFTNISNSLLVECLESTRIHAQSIFREVSRVNKVVKESLNSHDEETNTVLF
ncbi:MAG: hypothetical protein IH613_02745 [Desulfuromonadales bacterium]|nr:hypothetical protein [Desulfuromonadales bacterium]